MHKNHQIVAINYADEKFQKQQLYNTKTAYKYGKVDKVIEYSPKDIDENFREKNSVIFAYKRGAGLWLWKPYLILKTLNQLEEGDFLFYCDSGVIYIDSVNKLIETMELNNTYIMCFGLPLLNRQFTKKETFILMNYDNYRKNQILASYILLKKNAKSLNFVTDWLKYCEEEKLLSPQHFTDIQEFEDFVAHREDQSIFSVIAHKMNLQVFRDPSDYGEMPFIFVNKRWTYSPCKYSNSKYPTILVSCRSANPKIYMLKYRIKSFLNKIGFFYTESNILRKRGIR